MDGKREVALSVLSKCIKRLFKSVNTDVFWLDTFVVFHPLA